MSVAAHGRLVVVSNRVAVPRAGRAASGGLAVAVQSAMAARGGVWFGWNGRQVAHRPDAPRHQSHEGIDYVTLPLVSTDYDEYYQGFANRVLWPLMHYRLTLLHYRRRFFEGYLRVNAWFAEHLVDLLRADDTLWIHDYHLMPLGAEIRARGFKGPMGFFLHTPFPPLDILRSLPPHRELLGWLATYDLLGFQTDIDQRAFLDSICEELGAKPRSGKRLIVGTRRLASGVFPIGIDVEEVINQARRGQSSRQVATLKASLEGRRLIIGADRLDYSKGLVERFRAYQHLLGAHPELYGDIVYLQIAEPSRSEVPEYREVRHVLDQVAGEIIGSYARFDWMPVRYLSRRMPRPTLLAFLSVARVGLITPLRDGMNLVAKEFVAAQDPEDPGVLVLSEMAGAARQLSDAVLVNPYDIEGVSSAIAEALAMPLEERRARWERLHEVVRHGDIKAWSARFLNALEEAVRGRHT